MKITLHGTPITKKNSQRVIMLNGHPKILPSQAFKNYERECLKQIPAKARQQIDAPVNLRVTYYMPTRRRVDLVNLLEATCDILVSAKVLADDNCKIVAAHDGCRVRHDPENPRAEIEILRMVED